MWHLCLPVLAMYDHYILHIKFNLHHNVYTWLYFQTPIIYQLSVYLKSKLWFKHINILFSCDIPI